MDVLVLPVGSTGDVLPMLGLGRALADRGHAVTVGANGAYEALVARAGLPFAEVGPRRELEAVFDDPAYWHPRIGYKAVVRRVVLPAMRRQLALIEQRAKVTRPVVVAGTNAVGARLAHAALGVPLATIHLQPMVLWSEHNSPVLGPLWMADSAPRRLRRAQHRLAEAVTVKRWLLRPANRLAAELGLAPLHSVADAVNSPQLAIGLFPDWVAAPQPDWPRQLQLTDFARWNPAGPGGLSPPVAEFLDRGPPPVVFTLSSTRWRAAEFWQAAIEACRIHGGRGILLGGHPADLTALPPQLCASRFEPLDQLLPRTAAIVHHGGIGTAARALAAGVPQVVRPACFDQPDNAARLQRLGVATVLRPRHLTGPRLAAALARQTTSDAVRQRCADAAARSCAADGALRAAELVETLAPR